LRAPDVHEILSLNIALRQVPQQGEGYNILVQDDVIIADRNFEKKVIAVNAHFGGRIGVLSFRHGINLTADAAAGRIEEVDLIESSYGYGGSAATLAPGFAVERMVCLRSPQCVSFDTVRQIGLLNEKYAPYTYDDHDYGMRCLQAGRTNVVYSVKFRSRVEWGGMRRKPQPGVVAIMNRNKGYVYEDYGGYIPTLARAAFLSQPVLITGAGDNEDAQVVLQRYEMSRARLESFNRRRSLNIGRRLREKLGF
jgi:hypothetical protein